MTKAEKTQARTGGETAPERFLDRHLGNAVHLFLTLLAVLILVAAAIATFEIIIRDVPMLWRQTSEYDALLPSTWRGRVCSARSSFFRGPRGAGAAGGGAFSPGAAGLL